MACPAVGLWDIPSLPAVYIGFVYTRGVCSTKVLKEVEAGRLLSFTSTWAEQRRACAVVGSSRARFDSLDCLQLCLRSPRWLIVYLTS